MWKNQKFILLIHSATIPPLQQPLHHQFSPSAFKSVTRNYQCYAPSVTRKDSCYCSTRNMKRFVCAYKYYNCDAAGARPGGASILQRIRTVRIPVQAQQRNFSLQHLVHSTSTCHSQCSWWGTTLSNQSSHTAHLLASTRNYSNKATTDPELDAGSRRTQGTGAKIFDHPLSPKKGEGVEIIYFRGLPQITVPLPSRREKCRFILKPLTNSVGDLVQMIRTEDKGVDHISLLSKDGVRIASSNTIEMLMEQDFSLIINDILYEVVTPPQEKPSKEDLERLSSVRNLVGQLYAALNVDEHQLRLEREMVAELEKLQVQLNPLEEKRDQLSQVSSKRTNLLTWAGLGLMSVQFGILARLTWYEYSWDIMEPVTYFVTYGTAMLCYAYFVLTKQDYVLPEVRDRQYLIQFHKNAKKVGLDVEKYNQLKSKIAVLETNLHRLRDPLSLHLPPSKSRPLDLSKIDSLGGEPGFINRAHQKIQELLKKTRNPS